MRFLQTGSRRFLYAQQQWAPLRTSHDPNPPITLEDAVVTDTGPIGTGVNCLEFANYDEVLTIDENSWFFVFEISDTGPIGFGINCLEYTLDLADVDLDENAIFFINEDFVPPVVSVVFLRPSRIYYAT